MSEYFKLVKKSGRTVVGAFLATAFAPLAVCDSLDVEALVRGEVRDLATDSERYSFLRYEELRLKFKESEEYDYLYNYLTTCEILYGKSLYLLSDFAAIRGSSLFRDLSYCHYLRRVTLDVSDVSKVKKWLTKKENVARVEFDYSYEQTMEHYVSLPKSEYNDWNCSQFRGYLSAYERASEVKYPQIWATFKMRCEKN